MPRTEQRKRRRGLLATLRGRKGLVASELALIAPVFFLIVLATTDVVRVFRAQIRMEMIAVQIGQIVSQCTRISTADFPVLSGHAARIAGGLLDVQSTTRASGMYISALSRSNNANLVNWQQRTGNQTFTSTFGAQGNTNAIIGGSPVDAVTGLIDPATGTQQPFVIPAGQTLFGTEVWGVVTASTINAGLIGPVLPNELRSITMFLSRTSDPARLQQAPTVSGTKECTA